MPVIDNGGQRMTCVASFFRQASGVAPDETRRSLEVRLFGNGQSVVGSVQGEGQSDVETVEIERDNDGLAGFRVIQSTLQVTGPISDEAASRGIREQQVIVKVDDHKIRNWNEYKKYAYGNPKFSLSLRRPLKERLSGATFQRPRCKYPSIESSQGEGQYLNALQSLALVRDAMAMSTSHAGGKQSGHEASCLPFQAVVRLVRKDWFPFCIGLVRARFLSFNLCYTAFIYHSLVYL